MKLRRRMIRSLFWALRRIVFARVVAKVLRARLLAAVLRVR